MATPPCTDNLLSRNACTGVGTGISSGVSDLDRVIGGGGAAKWVGGGVPAGPADGMGGLAPGTGAKTWSAGAEAAAESVTRCGRRHGEREARARGCCSGLAPETGIACSARRSLVDADGLRNIKTEEGGYPPTQKPR